MKRLETLGWAFGAWVVGVTVIVACGPVVPVVEEGDGTSSTTATTSSTGDDPDESFDDEDGIKYDEPWTNTDAPTTCGVGCDLIDLLIVIDNSGTMGEEQLNLARNFPLLVDELLNLTDSNGDLIEPDVNIMVTTTDFGHPLCSPFQKPDYTPRQGAPVYDGCNARIQRFTGLDPMDPVVIEEACTEGCPVDVAPIEPFINFSSLGSNVPNDDVHAALSCIGPQGIDGCGFESPLETMLRGINEAACWNYPHQRQCDEDPEWADLERGFMREGATLAIMLVTDEMDCSVQAPGGYSYFTDPDNTVYWNMDPALGIPRVSSAICFNAGVSCTDVGGDGLYESCEATDTEALHPIERYTSYFEYLREAQDKDIVMLGIFGVPEVVAHNPEPPYQPIAGGALDLVHRVWEDFPYPAGDILPEEWDEGIRAADKTFEFGAIAPGCTGIDQLGAFTGQGLPPLRLREVCESLDYVDENGQEQVKCCMESICGTDFSPAIRCLTGVVAQAIDEGG